MVLHNLKNYLGPCENLSYIVLRVLNDLMIFQCVVFDVTKLKVRVVILLANEMMIKNN